jgi:EAL domain-containing protein (putative c-di-GMP-specific phosphodiesterase class I)
VLNDALMQCRIWNSEGLVVPVAVNLSMRDLQDPQLPETVSALLARWRVPASQLKLEITESRLWRMRRGPSTCSVD